MRSSKACITTVSFRLCFLYHLLKELLGIFVLVDDLFSLGPRRLCPTLPFSLLIVVLTLPFFLSTLSSWLLTGEPPVPLLGLVELFVEPH